MTRGCPDPLPACHMSRLPRVDHADLLVSASSKSSSIRLASAADQPAVESIVAKSYGKYVARIGRKPGPMLDNYGSLIDQGFVHVLDNAGQIDGLVVLVPEAEAMLLNNVAVRPEAQGQGFGRLLLEFAEASARRAGFRSIRLYTHEMMTENLALYARRGFVETHRAEEEGLHRVFMSKRLRSSLPSVS